MSRIGWNGQILWVDLSSGEHRTDSLDGETYRQFIGGKGLGAYLLYRHLGANIDPLSADNILILLSGPLQGLPGPSVGRWSVVTKSPLTGIFLDSHCGGATGRDIKKAGYDAICIKGACSEPSILVIDNNEVSIRPASKYWGKGVYATTNLLHEGYGDGFSVYAIGPAGENKVRYATACCEIAHQTGRGGIGAVLGSKKIKAIVVRGTNSVPAHDIDLIRSINRKYIADWKTLDIDFKKYGTRHLVEIANHVGQFPTRNWQNGYFDEFEELSHIKMEQEYGVGNHHSCPHCVMRCTHAFSIPDPNDGSRRVESMIEYETLGLLGGNLGISDPLAVLQLNYICDDLGLDTISAGAVIGFAMEAYERGMLSKSEIGFEIGFGDANAAAKMVSLISSRSDIGDTLAEGVRRAAEMLGKGTGELAVHVKGLEVPAWDPRGRLGQGLLYATGDIGASHLRGWPPTSDPPDRPAVDFVEKLLSSRFEKTLKDSMIICHFTNRVPITMEQMRALLNGATGADYTLSDLETAARRIETLIRLFNIREGISRRDDTLPPRLWEPQTHGPRKGMRSFVSKDDFEESLSRYYQLMGWDSMGIPKEDTLKQLGLASQ